MVRTDNIGLGKVRSVRTGGTADSGFMLVARVFFQIFFPEKGIVRRSQSSAVSRVKHDMIGTHTTHPIHDSVGSHSVEQLCYVMQSH